MAEIDPPQNSTTPILAAKDYSAPSVFNVENLMREARRQKRLSSAQVPPICVLDPDGDLVDYLRASGQAQPDPTWACYHTALYHFVQHGRSIGIIGRVVGASFAVLVAEELFASGCQLLISVTSAGQIRSLATPPYVMLIEQALRDEGTSYHYLPPARYSALLPNLRDRVLNGWDHTQITLYSGASWTTDAPFRETEAAIAVAQAEGIAAVEMEAAALYALATAKKYPIICFAYVTNTMAQAGEDFEKGPDQGSHVLLCLISQVSRL